MIFVIEHISEVKVRLERYESIEQLVGSLEWQDVYGGAYIIIAEDGIIYEWDKDRKEEFGTLYDYTMIKSGINCRLANTCSNLFREHPHTDAIENVADKEIITSRVIQQGKQ